MWVAGLAAAVVAASAAPVVGQGAPALLGHRVIYALSLAEVDADAQITAADGRLYFSFLDRCERWDIESRDHTAFVFGDGEVVELNVYHTASETKDGDDLVFDTRRVVNGIEEDHVVGIAALDAFGGSADYRRPLRYSLALEPGTLFPAAHTQALVARAERGERFFSVTMFDGSDRDGLGLISAVLGSAVAPSATAAPPLDVTAWPVSMAYFDLEEASATPSYEVSFLLYRNGIWGDMRIDYGDYTIGAEIEALEALPAACADP